MSVVARPRLDDDYHIHIKLSHDFKSANTELDEDLIMKFDEMRGCIIELTNNPYVTIKLQIPQPK
jgi:hypothetical protein